MGSTKLGEAVLRDYQQKSDEELGYVPLNVELKTGLVYRLMNEES